MKARQNEDREGIELGTCAEGHSDVTCFGFGTGAGLAVFSLA